MPICEACAYQKQPSSFKDKYTLDTHVKKSNVHDLCVRLNAFEKGQKASCRHDNEPEEELETLMFQHKKLKQKYKRLQEDYDELDAYMKQLISNKTNNTNHTNNSSSSKKKDIWDDVDFDPTESKGDEDNDGDDLIDKQVKSMKRDGQEEIQTRLRHIEKQEQERKKEQLEMNRKLLYSQN